ncbi:MAG: hypothetical protein ACNYPI_07635 [Arenicellales bacterium WSBS_2016_MAG_OTU3]
MKTITLPVIAGGRIGKMHADIFERLNGVCLHRVIDRRQEGPN